MILNCTTWAIVRRLTYRRPRRSTLCCCAWTSVCSSLVLFAAGGFTIWISVEFDAGSSWIGFVIVLSALYWTIQAMKYHKSATTLSAGYQPFNEQPQSQEEPLRRSNAPLIVEVDSNGPNSQHPMSLDPNMSSTLSPKSIYSQSLIRNAVPPSPFIGTQGTDSYVAIPMSITKSQPRSDYGTPQGTHHTLGSHLEEENLEQEDEDKDCHSLNDTLTEPHAEDSIYIEEVEEEEDVDGKQEEKNDTLGGPERKTSE